MTRPIRSGRPGAVGSPPGRPTRGSIPPTWERIASLLVLISAFGAEIASLVESIAHERDHGTHWAIQEIPGV